MITLTAILRAKQGREAELESLLKAVVPKVEAEAGTLRYILHRHTGEPGTFFFYEQYTDKAALDFHSSTPYLKELFGSIADLLAEKPVISLYEEIAAIQRP